MNEQIGAVVFCALFASVISHGSPSSSKYLPPHKGAYEKSFANRPSQQYVEPQNNRNSFYNKVVNEASSSRGFERHIGGGVAKQFPSAPYIPITSQDFARDANGNYNFGFQTANGIRRNEAGDIVYAKPQNSLNVHGSYSYTGDDGRTYTVNYRADENGFHAEGDHLPTSPPAHDQFARAGYGKQDDGIFKNRRYQSSSRTYSPVHHYLPTHRR